jgi:hypothetical protein
MITTGKKLFFFIGSRFTCKGLHSDIGGRRGRDRMVVGFITTCAYHH